MEFAAIVAQGMPHPLPCWLYIQLLFPLAGLPLPLRQEWRLLFNSSKHGMSYSTFLGRLGEACPTLLLVRDKGGAVFGGIAHAPWQKTGTFYGEPKQHVVLAWLAVVSCGTLSAASSPSHCSTHCAHLCCA